MNQERILQAQGHLHHTLQLGELLMACRAHGPKHKRGHLSLHNTNKCVGKDSCRRLHLVVEASHK